MRIQVQCTSCGERSDLPPDQIALFEVSVPADEPRGGHYRFRCTWCGCDVQRPADARAIGLLQAGGVETTVVLPAHPEQPPAGPPLTLDDLLDLHDQLADPGWFDRLASLVDRH